MVEVEIRGKLTEEQYSRLREFLALNGKLKEKHDREMYLLYDYPGYHHDPTLRDVDIRLRCTNGRSEIMVKQKLTQGNHARQETSLELKDPNLHTAKQVLKAMGISRGLKMQREKEVYEHQGVEWSLVNCPPKNIKYFEAEKVVGEGQTMEQVHEELFALAKTLGFPALNDDEMREFIFWLDKEVNEEVTW